MRELIIERIKVMTRNATYGSMRWDALFEHLKEDKNLSTKVLRTTQLFDLFDFASISDTKLIEYFEFVVRKYNTQM